MATEKRERARSTAPAEIPELVVRKLAKIAKLNYCEGSREGGGGLCKAIEGGRARRRALALLGRVALGGTETIAASMESLGATWLDVLGWREDPEYSKLWEAARRSRREDEAAQLEDSLWDRARNGFTVQEAKKGEGGIEKVEVQRFDNGLGVYLLRSLGFVAPRDSRRRGDSKAAGAAERSDDGNAEPQGPDTVLFADRRTAYDVMGSGVEPQKS